MLIFLIFLVVPNLLGPFCLHLLFFSSHHFITEMCRKLTLFLTCDENIFPPTHFNSIAVLICTRLLFKKEKPPAHGREDNMIWAQRSCRIKETSNWAWAGRDSGGSKWLCTKRNPHHKMCPTPLSPKHKIKKHKKTLLL